MSPLTGWQGTACWLQHWAEAADASFLFSDTMHDPSKPVCRKVACSYLQILEEPDQGTRLVWLWMVCPPQSSLGLHASTGSRQGIQRSGAYQRVVLWEVAGTTYHSRHSNGKAGCWAIHHRQKRTWHLVKRILPATFRYDNVWIGLEMSKVKSKNL